MGFRSLLGLQNKKKSRTRKSRRCRKKLTFDSLESRRMLAGIFFDSGTGFVTVAGDNSSNIGQFTMLNGSTVRATMDATYLSDFNVADVTKIIFIGFGGNDRFTNSTAIDSLLLGNDGNDILTGGSGFDAINGGNDNDQIFGEGGNDRLFAGFGNDRVDGGDGNDTMFGTAGTNTINGDAGDDIVFGGDGVDTINGGEGIDSIFAGAGNDILSAGNGGVPGSPGVSQADLILGLGGDDTFVGGTGLNVFWGGDGNDTMIGGSGENRMHGQNGNDDLTGGASADYMAGHLGNDTINGEGGADYILPGFGDDTITGGDGTDFVVFNGAASDYRITGSSDPLTVTDTRGIDRTDTISTAETFRYSDGDQPAGPQVTHVLTVQPIIVSNSNGSNTAEFFGNNSEESTIMDLVDVIFLQAGVDVVWESPNYWNNTFANVGNGGERPSSDLNTVVTQGDAANVGNSDPLILDLYLVEVSAGFSETTENTVNGLAFVGANGITLHVGDNLPGFASGREIVAETAAHEIAHNLGLYHVSDPDNLMGNGDELTASQIETILNSQYTIPV